MNDSTMICTRAYGNLKLLIQSQRLTHTTCLSIKSTHFYSFVHLSSRPVKRERDKIFMSSYMVVVLMMTCRAKCTVVEEIHLDVHIKRVSNCYSFGIRSTILNEREFLFYDNTNKSQQQRWIAKTWGQAKRLRCPDENRPYQCSIIVVYHCKFNRSK